MSLAVTMKAAAGICFLIAAYFARKSDLAKISNEEIIIVQIAGLIARRIVCEVEQDQELKQGERIGMIRFGSRVDIYFKNKKVLAKLGQNVVAGESLLASE